MLPAGKVLLALVTARKVWFNHSGPATAGLIVAAVAVAVLTGLLFRGKSGWCTGMCPLLPVERLYGQVPWIRLGDTHCGGCVSCTRHCPERMPGAAAMVEFASQTAGGKRRARLRRLLAAVFPGFVAGYFLVPSVPAVTASTTVAGVLGCSVLSGVVFAFLDHLPAQFRFALIVTITNNSGGGQPGQSPDASPRQEYRRAPGVAPSPGRGAGRVPPVTTPRDR